MKKLFLALGALFVLALAQPVSAQVTIGSNAPAGQTGFNSANSILGEIVTPPNADPLLRYSFWIQSGAPFEIEPVIYVWDGPTTVGTPLWVGPTTTISSPTFVETAFTPNIALDPANQYVLAIRLVGSGSGSVQGEGGGIDDDPGGHYVTGGTGTWRPFPTEELHFTATFGFPAAIPTLSEWAMILLGVLLAGGAALTINRRRTA